MDLIQIVLLIITVLLLALFLFVGDKLIGNKNVHLTSGYYINALITAAIIIVVIIVAGILVDFIDFFGIGQILPILAFIFATFITKMFLVKGDFQRAMWVTLIAWILVYVVEYVAGLFDMQLMQFI